VVFQGPRVGGRQNYFRALGFDTMRGLGISSVVYELGKNFLGADLSRGLYAQAAFDLFGGERFLEDGNEWIPVPPILDIPTDLAKGFAMGDFELMRQSLSRLAPFGGVAISRLTGMLPKLPSPVPEWHRIVQNTYADFNQRAPDGRVPLYAGDGRLIDYRSATQVVLRGLGVDLGRWRNAGELDHFLVAQRDEIVEARRQMLQALLSNELGKVEGIRTRFQKRFGFPLTIDRDQLRQAIRLRQQPRVERLLDRLPTEARPEYQRLVAATAPERIGLGSMGEEALVAAETARQRDILRGQGVQLDPKTIEALQQLLAEQQRQPGRSFTSFGGFQQ
jgi:hypothetical protein